MSVPGLRLRAGYQTQWIPPRDLQRQNRCSNIVFFVRLMPSCRVHAWNLSSETDSAKLSRFRTVRATIKPASLISEGVALGFELIHRNHQQNFGKSEAAERVLCDFEHNRRYRD